MALSENYNVYSPDGYSAKLSNPQERIEFIVDFSNSMVERINGERKIDIAVSTMEKILKYIPPSTHVGLRVYGQRSGITYYDSCKASVQTNAPMPNNRSSIRASLYKFSPRGATPITYSLKQAVSKDFGYFLGPKRIILLTDGGENCDESPCTFALDLIQTRNDIRIDVIALDVNDEEAVKQLRCAALATSGKFYSASTAAELLESFQDSLNINKEVQGVILP